MITPKQAYTILALAGLLSSGSALPQAVQPVASVAPVAPVASSYAAIPTSSFATSVIPATPSTIATGAPYPISGQSLAVGATGTAPLGSGAVGTGTASIPISTGTPSKSGKPGLAVWWGQSQHKTPDLPTQCDNENVDFVILSFLTKAAGAGGFPALNINTAAGPSEAQTKAGATDLIDGAMYVDGIKKCKANGKKVYLSLGGQTGEITFANKEDAVKLADQIFNLFLGGQDAQMKELRPFGDVVLDGIDFDMESKTPDHYEDFTEQLRKNMQSDSANQYKISAAPQCPRTLGKIPGDQSLPDTVLKQVDQVWVQFYNNPSCEHNATSSDGFMASVKEWSSAIGQAELYIGAPGGPDGAGSGNLTAADQAKEIEEVKKMNLPNFAGYALWDGPVAVANDNFDAAVKKALLA
jgi:chitinase